MRLAGAETSVEARNELVVAHLGLVKVLAARLSRRLPSQVEMSELVSVGIVGLVDAARRYQPSLGVPFDAFARRRVHGAMLDSLRGLDWAPRAVRKIRRDVDQALGCLRHELGREPSEPEIAERLNVTVDVYRKMLDQMRSVDLATIRQRDPRVEERRSVELTVDLEDGPQVRLERAELRQHLARALSELPERERQILSMYYDHELTLAEIGVVIGVGESRVSQLRTQAIGRLRARLRGTLQLVEP
jgi:RNA polymerase sigma factor for flagellar operon FliA